VSPPWRIVSDLDGLQLDFLDAIHGTSSFEGLRRRASEAHFGGTRLLVAALADIIKANGQAVRGLIAAVSRCPWGSGPTSCANGSGFAVPASERKTSLPWPGSACTLKAERAFVRSTP